MQTVRPVSHWGVELMDVVRLEVDKHIALVTLDHPPVNAFNRALRDQVIAAFDEISERDDVRVAVLTGAGKCFSAGADLRARPDRTKLGAFHDHNRVTRETSNAIHECSKPVIAAVNGVALGAGMGVMAFCDIFLAAEEAMFGMPEINVGLAGGAAMLNRLFGQSLMRRMMYTGLRISAAELYRRCVIEAGPGPRDGDRAMTRAGIFEEHSPVIHETFRV